MIEPLYTLYLKKAWLWNGTQRNENGAHLPSWELDVVEHDEMQVGKAEEDWNQEQNEILWNIYFSNFNIGHWEIITINFEHIGCEDLILALSEKRGVPFITGVKDCPNLL